VTSTSGPGLALKAEAMGLAVMTELPIVVVDVQRGGPSTGLPTKTEQSDLLQAMYGRSGEAPVPILAASTPADCFDCAITAMRIATKYMIPVVLLSDGYLANGAEPWRLPDVDKLEPFQVTFETNPEGFAPYKRNASTLARPWAIPARPGLEHRIGGIEKQDVTGNVSYDPDNHEHMSRTRAERVERVAQDIPLVEPYGDPGGTLMLSWGGTFGAVHAAVAAARSLGIRCGQVHLRWLNPFPRISGGPRAVRPRDRARAQPRAALEARAREVPRRRDSVHEDPGTALQGERAAREDRLPPRTRAGSRARGGRRMSHDHEAPPEGATEETPTYTKKDFMSDQTIRWCPGCGDYAILSQAQTVFAELGIPKHNFAIVSGIGCSSRFPYYMNTYGFHTIHGRRPPSRRASRSRTRR
jgi:hypothetical protein